MPTWQAERLLDESLVRQLLGQFGELDLSSLRQLSEGWDRSVWLVDESLVFGFPRRAAVVPGIERELEFLPRLAPLLPVEIPVPLYVGKPSELFPWPFFGSALVLGLESGDAGLDDHTRTEISLELAGFLRRLHSAELADELGAEALPVDLNGRADMTTRVPHVREALTELESVGVWRAPPAVFDLLRVAELLPPSEEPLRVAHGDLHFRHVLVDDRRLCGVIDWIDLCRSDPAIDLQLLWSFVPSSSRAAFVKAYGQISETQLLRARVVALSLAGSLALYGSAEGRDAITLEALASLDRTISE